jgi:hypothetical protein
MRALSFVFTALASTLTLLACSGEATSPPAQVAAEAGADVAAEAGADVAQPDTATTEAGQDGPVALGTVTLRFKNDGAATVYVDVTFGGQLAITSSSHAEPYALSTACTQPCPCGEGCVQCGAPQPAVKVLAPGEHFDMPWSGTYYAFQPCADSWCQCHDALLVQPGTFAAALPGALGVTGGTPDAQDPSILLNAQIDETKGTCSAKAPFEMNAEAHTVEIVFDCSGNSDKP